MARRLPAPAPPRTRSTPCSADAAPVMSEAAPLSSGSASHSTAAAAVSAPPFPVPSGRPPADEGAEEGRAPSGPLAVPDIAGDPPSGPGVRGSATTPTLFLSVFLLLAGFFVLLIALSEFDRERTKRVLRSLERQFSAPVTAVAERPAPPAEGSTLARGSGNDALRDLRFGPPLTAEAERAGVVGRVELASARLFDGRGEIPRARWLLFGRMAAATRDPRGWILEIAAPRPTGREVTALARRLQRVLTLLDRLGADSEAVTYGLLGGTGDRWSFTLRERDPEPAR